MADRESRVCRSAACATGLPGQFCWPLRWRLTEPGGAPWPTTSPPLALTGGMAELACYSLRRRSGWPVKACEFGAEQAGTPSHVAGSRLGSQTGRGGGIDSPLAWAQGTTGRGDRFGPPPPVIESVKPLPPHTR